MPEGAARGDVPLNLQVEFAAAVQRHGVRFQVQGLLAQSHRGPTLGPDAQVLLAVFELYCQPLIVDIADLHGLRIADAPRSVYPRFTLMRNEADRGKIAIDLTTPFRRLDITFPLGPYTSFSRNGTQDLLYPLDHYAEHWVIGFVCNRADDVEWFIQERFKAPSIPPPGLEQGGATLPAPTRR